MPVAMIVRRAWPPRRSASRADRMGIVIANQPLPIRRVQRQRVTDPVRAFRRNRDFLDDELDPVITNWINDKHAAIQREKVVKSLILCRICHQQACYHRMITLGKHNLPTRASTRPQKNPQLLLATLQNLCQIAAALSRMCD